MPLPSDEKLIALSQDVIQQFDTIFGHHPGFRPAHAKGTMLTGTFTPSSGAASLTRAPHMNRPSTPVTVRFSDATGLPMIPDNDPNAHPRGCAIRFHLAERVHTDIISSLDGWISDPDRAGVLGVAARGRFHRHVEVGGISAREIPWQPSQGAGLRADAQARAVQFRARSNISALLRCASPTRMARTAMGATGSCRTRVSNISRDAAAAAEGANFLFDELAERVAKGPIKFRVVAQLANDGDR